MTPVVDCCLKLSACWSLATYPCPFLEPFRFLLACHHLVLWIYQSCLPTPPPFLDRLCQRSPQTVPVPLPCFRSKRRRATVFAISAGASRRTNPAGYPNHLRIVGLVPQEAPRPDRLSFAPPRTCKWTSQGPTAAVGQGSSTASG